MTAAEIREGLEAHAANVQAAALMLSPPHARKRGERHWPPEAHDRHEYDMAVIRALAWQRDVILHLIDRPHPEDGEREP